MARLEGGGKWDLLTVVDPVGDGVSGGELEGLLQGGDAEGGGSWGGNDAGSGGVGGSEKTASWESVASDKGGGTAKDGGPLPPVLLTGGGGGLSDGSQVLGLGGGDLGGVDNWGGGDTGVDGGDASEDGGDWEVGGLDLESVDGGGDVLGSLEDAVGVNPAPASAPDSGEGVALLVPGRVGVAVAEGEVAELVLGVELLGVGSSWDGGHGGGAHGESGGDSGNWGGSHSGDTGVGDASGDSASGVNAGVSANEGSSVKNDIAGVGSSQGSGDSDKGLHCGDRKVRVV